MFQQFYKNASVLVTGHTGFKGSWLTEWLLQLGAKVSGFSLYIPSSPSHFEVLGLKDRIQHFEGDIRNLDSLKQAFEKTKPDIVFHMAAQPIVQTSYEDPAGTFSANLMGTVNILECLRQSKQTKAAIIVTSDKCYENVEWVYGYRESDRLGGKDPYSASKACAEIAFSSYVRSFFNKEQPTALASARAGNVIGGGDWADHRIIPDCVRALSTNRKPSIRNPESTRPWQHVLEPLSGYLWLAALLQERRKVVDGESYNFGPPSETTQTVRELIAEMKKHWPSDNWDVGPASPNHGAEAGLLRLSCDKAQNDLNWKPTLNFQETIELTSTWYSNFYKNPSSAAAFTKEQIITYQNTAKKRNAVWTK